MKKVTAVGLIGVMVLSLAGCGGNTSPSAQEPETAVTEEGGTEENVVQETEATGAEGDFSETYDWALATTYGSTTVVVQAYEKFAELVKEYTDGAVTITVYPDGQLAGEEDSMNQMSAGELEFVGTGSMPWWLYSTD